MNCCQRLKCSRLYDGHYRNTFSMRKAGQGLFYTGFLFNKEFSFVYDCGSSDGTKYLDISIKDFISEIKKEEDGKKIIDLLVISHFHGDHIGRIKELFNKAKLIDVKYPYLPEEELLFSLLITSSLVKNAKTNNALEKAYASVVEDYNFIREEIYKYNVGEYNTTHSDIDNSNNDYVSESAEEMYYSFDNDELFFDSLQWKFIFVNKRLSDAKKKYIDVFIKKMIGKEKDLLSFINNKGKIKSLTKKDEKVLGDINQTSLMLMHYPLYYCHCYYNADNKTAFLDTNKLDCECCCGVITHKKPATLLPGDGIIDSYVEQEFFDRSKADDIDLIVLQVPHHGAKDEWNKSSLSLIKEKTEIKYCVASFGIANIYKHPSFDVVNDLYNNNNNLYCSTQLCSFDYEIII